MITSIGIRFDNILSVHFITLSEKHYHFIVCKSYLILSYHTIFFFFKNLNSIILRSYKFNINLISRKKMIDCNKYLTLFILQYYNCLKTFSLFTFSFVTFQFY